MNSLKILLLSCALFLAFGSWALAQEEAISEVNLDENVQAEDLEISEPKILPDHPLYFLKNWGREIRTFFAFDPIKKAELREKFASEKLIELKKIIEKKKNPKVIERASENYEKEVERIKKITERIKQKAKENPKIGKFLDKFTRHQILHQRILQRLENQVEPEAFEKIKKARERHLKRFNEVMSRLEEKEKITERLEKNLEKIKGSRFKEFKNLEILKELEEKAPEEAKKAIRKARERTLKRLKERLEKMSPENQEKFKDYLQKISGDKVKQMEILENLRSELKKATSSPKILRLREKMDETREKIIERIEKRAKKINCPKIEKPAPGFCKEGRIIVKRDEKGCIVDFKCIIPGEETTEIIKPTPQKSPKAVCVALWDPVCGEDGKTYTNECWAKKVAGVKIAHKGVCKKEIKKELLPKSLPQKPVIPH